MSNKGVHYYTIISICQSKEENRVKYIVFLSGVGNINSNTLFRTIKIRKHNFLYLPRKQENMFIRKSISSELFFKIKQLLYKLLHFKQIKFYNRNICEGYSNLLDCSKIAKNYLVIKAKSLLGHRKMFDSTSFADKLCKKNQVFSYFQIKHNNEKQCDNLYIVKHISQLGECVILN